MTRTNAEEVQFIDSELERMKRDMEEISISKVIDEIGDVTTVKPMPNSRLAFDIETQPDNYRLSNMPKPEVKLGNLKDPAKIADKIAEAEAEQVERAALDANYARIVCISFAYRGIDRVIYTTTWIRQKADDLAGTDAAEAELLRAAWDFLSRSGMYVTFNGSTFDIPFMLRRSLILGVRPLRIDCHPYHVIDGLSEHLDLCKLLHDSETGAGGYKRNLHFYSRLFLGELPIYGTDLDKGGIGRLYDQGDWDLIRKVCRWDAQATLRLAEKVAPVYAGSAAMA